MICSVCNSSHWFIGDTEHGLAPRICMGCGAYAGEVEAEFELAIGVPFDSHKDRKQAIVSWTLYQRRKGSNPHVTARYIKEHEEQIIADMLANPDDLETVSEKHNVSISLLKHRRKQWGIPLKSRRSGNWASPNNKQKLRLRNAD